MLEEWGKRYNVPPERLYTDYKKMIAEVKPDIVSVVTQPEHRAEILIHAVELGLGHVIALCCRSSPQPLHAIFANIFGTSVPETTMRPNPRSSTARARSSRRRRSRRASPRPK